MTLDNFQGVKHFEIKPDGKDISVYGDNGTGKTTIYNAFCWLMYGKPSTDEKGFNPQTVGTHGLNHVAEMTVSLDDGMDGMNPPEITLKKDFHEVTTQKRAKNVTETKRTTDHYINGVPVKEKDYCQKVNELFGSEDTAKMLTRYNYFLEDMKMEDRRAVLLDICGEVPADAVIAADDSLKDLITSDLVKDTDRITVARPIAGVAGDIRKSGHWFNDQILENMDQEINHYLWNEEDGYIIMLKG